MKKFLAITAVIGSMLFASPALAAGTDLKPSAAQLKNEAGKTNGCSTDIALVQDSWSSWETICGKVWGHVRQSVRLYAYNSDGVLGDFMRGESWQFKPIDVSWESEHEWVQCPGLPFVTKYVVRARVAVWDDPDNKYVAVVDDVIRFPANCGA